MTQRELEAILADPKASPDQRRKAAENLRVLTLDPLGVAQEKDARIRQTQDRIREKIAAAHPRAPELQAKLERLEGDRQLIQHRVGRESILKGRRGPAAPKPVVIAPPAGHAKLGRS